MASALNRRNSQSGYFATLRSGFYAVKVQDNTNVYGVIVSECVSNMFKDGMWMKMLTPYMLIVSGGDRTLVGNAITLNGLTRAASGVFAGRYLMERFGVDGTFVLAGLCGMVGMGLNFYCLLNTAIGVDVKPASGTNSSVGTDAQLMSPDTVHDDTAVEITVTVVFLLNFVWAFFNGLWNTCLETEWARSVLHELREDTNGTRQVLNKSTTAMGPLFSIVLLLAWGSNKWSVPLVSSVMLVGTALTGLPVILCFRFSRNHEVQQEVMLCEIDNIEFREGRVHCCRLKRKDFHRKEGGLVKLTYPIKDTSKFAKLRVLTPDLKETGFVLGKQEMSWFQGVTTEDNVCFIHFTDPSRAGARAVFESATIFLSKDGLVNPDISVVHFRLYPDLKRLEPLIRSQTFVSRVGQKIMGSRSMQPQPYSQEEVRASLLPNTDDEHDGTSSDKKRKAYKPNMRMANLIVYCDVLNAVGSGMSLKFMDIFLIQEYGVSPVGILLLSFVQNLAAVYFTPVARQIITAVRKKKLKGALGVSIIWGSSLFFLGLVCIPDMPLLVILVSIVLMQSLSSCTKAYNRGKLQSSLPPSRVGNYMVWDSLNKANQGGIAIFGAQLVNYAGYRGCFTVTFLLLLLRWLLWTGDIVFRRGLIKNKYKLDAKPAEAAAPDVEEQTDEVEETMDEAANWMPDEARADEVDSELFQRRLSIAEPNEGLVGDVLVIEGCEGHGPDTPLYETSLTRPLLR